MHDSWATNELHPKRRLNGLILSVEQPDDTEKRPKIMRFLGHYQPSYYHLSNFIIEDYVAQPHLTRMKTIESDYAAVCDFLADHCPDNTLTAQIPSESKDLADDLFGRLAAMKRPRHNNAMLADTDDYSTVESEVYITAESSSSDEMFEYTSSETLPLHRWRQIIGLFEDLRRDYERIAQRRYFQRCPLIDDFLRSIEVLIKPIFNDATALNGKIAALTTLFATFFQKFVQENILPSVPLTEFQLLTYYRRIFDIYQQLQAYFGPNFLPLPLFLRKKVLPFITFPKDHPSPTDIHLLCKSSTIKRTSTASPKDDFDVTQVEEDNASNAAVVTFSAPVTLVITKNMFFYVGFEDPATRDPEIRHPVDIFDMFYFVEWKYVVYRKFLRVLTLCNDKQLNLDFSIKIGQ